MLLRFARVLGYVLFTSFLLLVARSFAQETAPPYKNASLPVDQRVADLLSRMTLEEKVAQLVPNHDTHLLDTTGQFQPEQAPQIMQELFRPDSRMSPHDRAVFHNAVQRYLLEKTRLGIPQIFMGEALHGFMAYGATSFPQVLGLASTWDPDLVREVFTAASDEMGSTGVDQAFTPVLDLARDPRWGRTEETYGEDPYLVSRMGVAAILGLQGVSETIDRHHVLATAKHFAAHGQPEGGVNTAPANLSERLLRESFFLPFQAAVEEAHVGSVMASYNEIDGIPSHINPWLLQTVLRNEWGFKGYVTSDGEGLQMLVRVHDVAANFDDAARMALAAGIEYDLSDGSVFRTLTQQVKDGKVPMSEIDRAVSDVLAAKFRLGLFDNPYVDPGYATRITNSPEHRALATKAAREAIVLLKNQGNLLPLDLKKLKSIAVIGPDAADVHVGGYSRDPGHGVSILDGIRSYVGGNANVLYSEGCKITLGKQGWAGWYEDNTKLADAGAQLESIRAAAETARRSDVAIVVVGETESTNREAWADNHRGDRDSLNLLGAQNDLVKAVVETGTPTVVLLLNGRPLAINSLLQTVPAILEGWYLGQEGGTAAAEVLFGDANPGGKLPISFPKTVGQLPDYYNHKPSSGRHYVEEDRGALLPFGYGLSYTTFKFDMPRVSPIIAHPGDPVTVTAVVTNTGSREGDEVAQLYFHERVTSVTQPVLQLRGFQRIHLKPGESKTVEFKLPGDAFAFLNAEMKRVTEPGTVDLFVGPNSVDTNRVSLTIAPK